MKALRPLIVLSLLAAVSLAAQESTVVVPVAGMVFGQGGVLWKTDVEIVNDTGAAAMVALDLPTAPGWPEFAFDLAAGETARFHDLMGELFGGAFGISPLRVTSNTRRGLTVRATVYAVRGGWISAPQVIGVHHGNAWFPLRALDDLAFTDDHRTNIGLVNLSTHDADFTLALQRVPGRNLAVTRLSVPAGSHFHSSIQTVFPLITKGDHLTVVVETSTRETYCFASVIDDEHAGRFVMPRMATR